MILFWASLAALFVGPLLLGTLGHRRSVVALLDGYVMVAVGGLILLDVLPHAIHEAGAWAVLGALVGLSLPMVVERSLGRLGKAAHRSTVLLALAGLAVHSIMDGMALKDPHGHGHAEHLAVGVVLHRLPLGVLIWGMIRPWAGRLGALGLLGLEAAGTGVGFFVGVGFEGFGLGLFEGVVAGALMHVVMYDAVHGSEEHGHDEHENTNESDHVHGGGDPVHEDMRRAVWERQAGVVGAFAGVATLLGLGDLQLEHATEGFGSAFLTLALESAPALLLAFIGAGLMRAFLLPATIGWLSRGSPPGQAVRGLAFGMPLPVCSCGVLPLYEGLIVAGAPVTAALAFLVATPALGLDAVFLSLPLLGGELGLLRLVAAVGVAVGVALLVGSRLKARARLDEGPGPRSPLRDRLRVGLRFGLAELVDHTLPWVLLGLTVATLAAPLLAASGLATLSPALQVPLLALLGMPLYLCASGAMPLVALLISLGLSPGAALAFLLTGPITHPTTFGVLRRLHGRGAAFAFGLVILLLASAAGWGVNLWASAPPPLLTPPSPESIGLLKPICLAVLAALFLASLVRQGPRGLVAQITHPMETP